MDNSDRQRLLHIITYCNDIAGFIDRFGEDYQIFISDRAYFNAVSMCIMQIGELANGLSDEFRKQTKGRMPWGMVRGIRNWIAHAYHQMSEEIIWETASRDIPTLLRLCETVLEEDRS
jgi:uncharacterized protein with HEPN domain